MNKIGVAVSGLDEIAGPMMVAVVEVDSNFFRNHSYVKPKEPSMDESIKVFDRINQKVEGNWVPIKVDAIKKTDDLNGLIVKTVIDALNTMPEFWEKEISILLNEEVFIEHYYDSLSKNLKKIIPDLKVEKWNVSEKYTRVKALAKMFANKGLKVQQDEIKEVWGEFDELPSDCPYLRKKGGKQ